MRALDRLAPAQLTFGEVVVAVMHFAANSREAGVVLEDLLATGRIRFAVSTGMSRDGDVGSARRSANSQSIETRRSEVLRGYRERE